MCLVIVQLGVHGRAQPSIDGESGRDLEGVKAGVPRNGVVPPLSRYVATAQVMSWAQHMGDLIIPCPSGHLETATVLPSSVEIVPWTNSWSHRAQVMFTLIPHLSQV